MSTLQKLFAMSVAGVLLVGCNKEKKQDPVQPTPSAQPAPQADGTGAMNGPAITVTPPTTGAGTLPGAGSVLPATNPTTTGAAAGDASDASAQADAQAQIKQFRQDLSDKKWDAAETDLKNLDAHKDTLSAAMKQSVTAMRAQLQAAKAADKLKIPGLSGGNTPPADPTDANK